MRNRYRRIISETNSTLLVDTHTGDVLPEIVEAVSAPLVTQYRRQFGAEASTAEVKRAFIHFVQVMAFWETEVFFGRAGYNAQCRQRYIDSGPGNCFVFEAGTPSYRVVEGQPRIRPTQSRPLPSTAHVGNIQSGVFDTLFSGSVLPKESDLLLIAWMILSWMPDRKQVMLELLGKPSAALEEAQSLIKKVVDPATEALMNELPNHVKQFDQLATQHYLLSFNQVDALSSRQQAHFFNLMRGKQIQWEWKGKKTDARITVQCPVMLNSLESVATETKLANATLSLEVEESPSQYTGAALTSFQEPAIVAGLLMVFGQVNAQWNMVEYDGRYDRYDDLADLCRVGVLIAQIFCQDANVFWEQFQANQQGRRAFELEESPVALAVKKLLDDEPKGVIDIPAKEWKTRLAPYRPKDVSPELWPTHSRGVGAKFKQIQPLLRDVGITLTSKGQRGPLCYWRAEKAVVEQQEAE